MKALKRLLGSISLILIVTIMFMPFIITFILLGIDRANVMMSTILRVPMNWLFGGSIGDIVLKMHRDDMNNID